MHANANDYDYELQRTLLSGRKPRVVQIPIFSPDAPDCHEVMRNIDFEFKHGFDPYEKERT